MKPEKETKKEKFKRVAEARVNKITTMIRLLGNCSNEGVYEYTEEQVEKVFSFLEQEMREAKKRFKFNLSKEHRDKFVFDDEEKEG